MILKNKLKNVYSINNFLKHIYKECLIKIK